MLVGVWYVTVSGKRWIYKNGLVDGGCRAADGGSVTRVTCKNTYMQFISIWQP